MPAKRGSLSWRRVTPWHNRPPRSSTMQPEIAAPHGISTTWGVRARRNAPSLVVYGLLFVLALGATLYSNRFLTDRNLANVFRQAAFLGTVALGETLVILTGGIDLSVGSVVKLSVLVSAVLMGGKSENTLLAV